MSLVANTVTAASVETFLEWVFVMAAAAVGATLVVAGVIEGMPSIMQWTFTRASHRRQRS